ncbi:MAG: MerR family DNA-binding transcriptional regulator [Haloechinothrix sp.]
MNEIDSKYRVWRPQDVEIGCDEGWSQDAVQLGERRYLVGHAISASRTLAVTAARSSAACNLERAVDTFGQLGTERMSMRTAYHRDSSALEVQVMLIGEVARRSGVAAKTLRYYEQIELLDRPERSASGYRHYDNSVFERLVLIRSAQSLGLLLGEIHRIVALLDDGEMPCGHVLEPSPPAHGGDRPDDP